MAEGVRRLEADRADLVAENGRLRAAILRDQEEILVLGERLARCMADAAWLLRLAAWARILRAGGMGRVLRRRL